jgi:hypothetical protein
MPTGTDNKPKKHLCTLCGKEIVGVIPGWANEKPVCRDCTFKGPEKIPVPPRRGSSAVQWVERQKDARTLAVPIVESVAALFAVLLLFLWLKPAAMGPTDHQDITYEGDAYLDRNGQECVANLMVMSKYLSEGSISWPTRLCPSTGKFYDVEKMTGDVLIDCPNPDEHGLSRLWVGLKQPVVQAEKTGDQ